MPKTRSLTTKEQRRFRKRLNEGVLRPLGQWVAQLELDGLLLKVPVIQVETRSRPDVLAWLSDPTWQASGGRTQTQWYLGGQFVPPLVVLSVKTLTPPDCAFKILFDAEADREQLEQIARAGGLVITADPPSDRLPNGISARTVITSVVVTPLREILDALAATAAARAEPAED
jgi:hypothetical protein